MRDIPLFGTGIGGKSLTTTVQRRLNCYFDIRPDGDKTKVAIHGTPGLVPWPPGDEEAPTPGHTIQDCPECPECDGCGPSVCPELDFGCVDVGATSDSQTVTIDNPLASSITVYSVEVEGDPNFSIDVPATPFAIAAGGSQDIGVTLTPDAGGGFVGKLKVTSSAPTSPDYIRLTGAGCVAEPSMAMTVGPAVDTSACGCCCSFGAIYVFNNGDTTETVDSASVANLDHLVFAIVDDDILPASLSPGEFLQLGYSFCPTTDSKDYTEHGTINIGTSVGTLSHSISNVGTCVDPTVYVPQATVDFGSRKKSDPVTIPVLFKVVNSGCSLTPFPVVTFSVSVSDPFIDVPPASGNFDMCAGGGTFTVNVKFPVALDPSPTPYSRTMTLDFTYPCSGVVAHIPVTLIGVILDE